MPSLMRATLSLLASLTLLPVVSAAQQQPAREGSSIRRNLDTPTTIGEFRDDGPQRPPPPPPRGEVGGTGRVSEAHAPTSQLRGLASDPSGIDYTRPVAPGDLARIVRGREADLRPCYDRARSTRPTLAGRVNLRFVLQRDGRVRDVDVRGLPAAPEVARCMSEEIGRMRFPPPQGGAAMPFSYAMNFSPPPPPPRRLPRGRRSAR